MDEKRLAGLASFALASALPGPRAALSLGRARVASPVAGAAAAATAAAASSSSASDGPGGVARAAVEGGGVRAELVSMLAGVRLARPGLAKKLAAGVETAGVARGGVAVKEFVLRCRMTEPQAKVYAAVAR